MVAKILKISFHSQVLSKKDLPSYRQMAEMPMYKGFAAREVFAQYLPYTYRPTHLREENFLYKLV